VEASDALLHLQRRVETAVVAAGLEPERRKFRPHVTLARLKDASVGSVVSYLSEHPLLDIPPFTVDRFVLYRSFLRREGSVYRPEAVYPLGGWCDDGLEEEDGEDEATTAGWHAVTP
jgi:2'-5' RNA ligase